MKKKEKYKKKEKWIRKKQRSQYDYLYVLSVQMKKNKVKLERPDGSRFSTDIGWLLNGYEKE